MRDFLRSYKPKYFSTKELVSKTMYERRGEKALSLMDAHILYSADALRAYLTDLTPTDEYMAQLTCNSWSYGGGRHFSGLRSPGDDYYSPTSQHSLGKAIDLVSKHYPAEKLRNIIIDNRELFPYVTCIEMDVSWLHMDCRNLPPEAPACALMLVYPDGTYEYVSPDRKGEQP